MGRVDLRPYEPGDRDAVLAIFDGNADTFFGAGDRGWLAETLDEPDGPAFVVTVDGRVAAFGGYEIWDHYNKALLYWGMADRRYHGAGLTPENHQHPQRCQSHRSTGQRYGRQPQSGPDHAAAQCRADRGIREGILRRLMGSPRP